MALQVRFSNSVAHLRRQPHQSVRGGGAICFVGNDALWRAYFGIITALEPCKTDGTTGAEQRR